MLAVALETKGKRGAETVEVESGWTSLYVYFRRHMRGIVVGQGRYDLVAKSHHSRRFPS